MGCNGFQKLENLHVRKLKISNIESTMYQGEFGCYRFLHFLVGIHIISIRSSLILFIVELLLVFILKWPNHQKKNPIILHQ